MKKRLNITFFGICFLAALLAETYSLTALKGDLISSIGFGIVVLITGYLLLDSIISTLKQNMDNVKFYTDRILREETERWNERYTELANLQKATYTATKKNTIMISEQLKEVLIKYEALENGNQKELQRIIDLQKKSMEGQKNALNMEIHYNKENTKHLIEVLHEKDKNEEYAKQLSNIIELLEENKKLLSSGIVTLEVVKQIQNADQKEDNSELTSDFNINDYHMDEDIIEEDSIAEDRIEEDSIVEDHFEEDFKEEIKDEIKEEVNVDIKEDIIKDIKEEDDSTEAFMEPDLTENYLTEQDIARLDVPEESNDEVVTTAQTANDTGFLDQAMIDQMIANSAIAEQTIANPVEKEDDTKISEDLREFDNKEYQPKDFDVEISSPELPHKEEEPLEEMEPLEEILNTQEPEEPKAVTPLYSDPNKALTADEIAALFASFGQ